MDTKKKKIRKKIIKKKLNIPIYFKTIKVKNAQIKCNVVIYYNLLYSLEKEKKT